MKRNNIRLPKHIEPIRYKISLKPDLEAFTFEGQEVVFLNLKKAVREITLHSKELEIESSRFTSPNPSLARRGIDAWAGKIKYDEKAETATFKFNQKLPKGRGELRLVFRGVLNDKMRGFYRSKYTHEGKEKHLATTQFEATDARRAFPCVDEPAAKAIFDVSLIVPGSATAISNTLPATIREHESGYKIVEFGSTPKMSTYLVAFIVGDFEWIEGWARPHHKSPTTPSAKGGHPSSERRGKGTLVRVFTTPGKKHQAKFALDCAVKILEFYNQYFDIAYPLPVLDLIAIPDFAAGAMENWGAVTYRESALLVDEEKSSAANKQWVALVIAHELAHQWFGNLVTMEWWTHLWLNEGFASYIEYLAINHLFPKWDIWTQFAYNDLGAALRLDALNTTHPIEIEVRHPDEIGEIFDDVSYSKGSSVIRMLADYLGEKDFRDGLRYYLKKHSYANASTAHLWQAFEKVSKKPVEKIMKNWTGRPGYPLIRVEGTGLRDELKIEQSRFFSSAISGKQSKDKTLWQVPIKLADDRLKVKGLVLQDKTATISTQTQSKWLKVNPGETGFYRVSYPSELLSALKQPIESKKLAPIDRLGIIRDAFALAEAGRMPTIQALELAKSFKNEGDYTVWVELILGLDLLNVILFGQKGYEDFKKFSQELLKNVAKRVSWKKTEGEPHTAGLLRSLVLHHLGYYGDRQTVKNAQNLFRYSGKISPDLRGVVYNLIAENGGNKEFVKIKSLYIKEALHEEKNRLGRALASFRKPELLRETLKFSLSVHVRPQDSPSIIAGVWGNTYGRKIAWNFVKKNWKIFLQRYGEGGHMLTRMIKPAGLFISLDDAHDFKRFFKKNPAPGIGRTITQVLERIESNAAWVERDRQKILDWLKNQ